MTHRLTLNLDTIMRQLKAEYKTSTDKPFTNAFTNPKWLHSLLVNRLVN